MQKKPIKKQKQYDSDNDTITSSSESEGSTSPQQKKKQKKIASDASSPRHEKAIQQQADYINKHQQGSLSSSQGNSRTNILSQMTPQQQSLNQIRSIISSFYLKQQQPQQANPVLSHSNNEQKQSQLRMNLLEQQNRSYANKIHQIEQVKSNESKALKSSIAQIQSQLFDIRHRMESLNTKDNSTTKKQKENSNFKKESKHQGNTTKNGYNNHENDEKNTSISSITSSDSDNSSLNTSQNEEESINEQQHKSSHKYSSKAKKHSSKKRDNGIIENLKGYLILNAHKLQHQGKKNLLLKDILNKKIPDQTVISNHLMMERYDIVLREVLDIFLEYLVKSESLHTNTSYLLQTDHHRNNSQKKHNHMDYIKENNFSPRKQTLQSYDWSHKQGQRQFSTQDNKSTTRFQSYHFQNPLNSDNFSRYSQNRLTTNESNGTQTQLPLNNIQPFSQLQSQQSLTKSQSQNPIQQIPLQSQSNLVNQHISPLTTDSSPFRKSYNNDPKIQQITPISYFQNSNINIDQIQNLTELQNMNNQSDNATSAHHGRHPSSTKNINNKQISFHNQGALPNNIQNLQLASGNNSRGSLEWFQQQFQPNKKLPIQINMASSSSSRFNKEVSQGILKQNNHPNFVNTEEQGFETKGSASTRFSENARKYQRLNHAISDTEVNELKYSQMNKQLSNQMLHQQQQLMSPHPENNNLHHDNNAILHSFSQFQSSSSPNNQGQGSLRNNLLIPQVDSLLSSGHQHQLNNTSSLQLIFLIHPNQFQIASLISKYQRHQLIKFSKYSFLKKQHLLNYQQQQLKQLQQWIQWTSLDVWQQSECNPLIVISLTNEIAPISLVYSQVLILTPF